MYAATRYSTVLGCPGPTLASASQSLKTVCLSLMWSPQTEKGDFFFHHTDFTDFLDAHRVTIRQVPVCRHSKNFLKSTHGVIRSIFLRLTYANSSLAAPFSLQKAVRISNDLYGSHVIGACELVDGHCRPLDACPIPAPLYLFDASRTLHLNCKLSNILFSSSSAISPSRLAI